MQVADMLQKLTHFIARYRFPILVVALLLAAAGVYRFIQSRQPQTPPKPIPIQSGQTDATTIRRPGGVSGMVGDASPVSIRLSPGQAQPRAVVPLPVVTGDPLTQAEIEQILARLPALTPEPGDQGDFRLPGDPIPPPRPGETIREPFPPTPEPVQPEQVESGPLEVLRFSPEGEIPVAPFLSVTFNQPMVPLATVEELAAGQVPVRLEPPLPGTWRWLGTRTLTFQYDSELIDRLPKATEYHATIPAGTRSATGGELAQAVEWYSAPPRPR